MGRQCQDSANFLLNYISMSVSNYNKITKRIKTSTYVNKRQYKNTKTRAWSKLLHKTKHIWFLIHVGHLSVGTWRKQSSTIIRSDLTNLEFSVIEKSKYFFQFLIKSGPNFFLFLLQSGPDIFFIFYLYCGPYFFLFLLVL